MLELLNNRQVFYGENSIEELPNILETNKLKKPFLVMFDETNPICKNIMKKLTDANVEFFPYTVKTEPDLFIINGGRDIYLEQKCDSVVAVGGGSVLDAAKAIGMLSTNGGLIEQYQMEGKQVTQPCPMLISIPTTAGTGSEATKVSVVTNNYNKLKKSVYHNNMIADIVILDPTLTVGLNKKITAATGMDALSHAIESYVSLNANYFSEMYSLKAIELINKNLITCCNEPENIDARMGMLIGSYLGGCALVAGIGIAHIIAQPVGAMFKIPHGEACSILLPTAMELNLEYSTKKYAEIAKALGVYDYNKSDLENGKLAIERVKEIRSAINAPDSLTPYLPENLDMDEVLENIKNSTGHITCNPRPVDNELLVKAINISK
ncbi:iron-containing alcohol dehydrogenase [Defluviitalea phaphyphila]|uniref:iron-containing alcohol dehydrogenase n=1 Tax=Defluviitalea phaphyphila TaxID=1473580 RepID=UPI0009FC5C96|nr:iron-containing alcohol dehydrogenase [Defluviitalea phaphyphila]